MDQQWFAHTFIKYLIVKCDCLFIYFLVGFFSFETILVFNAAMWSCVRVYVHIVGPPGQSIKGEKGEAGISVSVLTQTIR